MRERGLPEVSAEVLEQLRQRADTPPSHPPVKGNAPGAESSPGRGAGGERYGSRSSTVISSRHSALDIPLDA